MNTTHRLLASLLTASVLVVSAAASHAAREPKPLPDFRVFIDQPMGFVFVKLPHGWKHVGRMQRCSRQAPWTKRLLPGAHGVFAHVAPFPWETVKSPNTAIPGRQR